MITADDYAGAIPIVGFTPATLQDWLEEQTEKTKNLVKLNGFSGRANQFVLETDADGKLERVIAGLGTDPKLDSIATLGRRLPSANYRLDDTLAEHTYELALGWALDSYRFTRYTDRATAAALHLSDPVHKPVIDEYEAIALCRDLITTPASDMLPHHLELEVRKVAHRHDATVEVTIDKDLVKKGYRTIYTVGQASASEPRLIDLSWGDPDDPHITLVGKGVCFDSGGLDIKPAAAMRTMKKDMGGAANALALADLIMRRQLKVRLRLLIPAVENAISSNAYRPGDVIVTYKGLSVEVGNTDAEGRLIMCDALALACEEKPQLLVDFSTLTGAARSAVGTEIAAMFANNDEVAAGITRASTQVDDPVCRLPLYAGYRSGLSSRVAHLSNIASFTQGGAIVAALFLQEFVDDEIPWVHYDIMGYNERARPAHPIGGEAMGLRATYRYIQDTFIS